MSKKCPTISPWCATASLISYLVIGRALGIYNGGRDSQSEWTKGSILTKIIGTYKSEMPGNSAGNYVTLNEFQSFHL